MGSSVMVRLRPWALVCLGAGVLGAGATPGPLGSEAARAWAHQRAERWTVYRTDARGHRQWTNRTFRSLDHSEQVEQLLQRLGGGGQEAWTALILLFEHPIDQWVETALAKGGDHHDTLAQLLYLRGYKRPGGDPFSYLGTPRLDRPWTQGWGLHLEPGPAWRFQWIPSAALLTPAAEDRLPKGLALAAQPSSLLHLKQLRPGLARLKALATEGITGALNQGTRGGFLFRHVDRWLKDAPPALEPLATREAWVLHYGMPRSEGPSAGTLVFIPGDLPARTQMMLGLLRLNPFSKGARSRTATWTGPDGDSLKVTQVRGAGGVLHLVPTPEGTWISDREAPLRAMFLERRSVTLAERREWCRTALAGMAPTTEVSLWVAPRNGAGAAFENAMVRRRLAKASQPAAAFPAIAKAAPRTGVLALDLGTGPTEALVTSFLRVDDEHAVEEPYLPAFTDDGGRLTPEQQRAYQAALAEAKARRGQQTRLRQDLNQLLGLLDLRGAALLWNGWVAPPPLTEAEKAAQVELQRLRAAAPREAARVQRQGRAGLFGGFGEPGLAPSLALALPVRPDKVKELQTWMEKHVPALFKGQAQKRAVGGVDLHRVRTHQAFTPCWALVQNTLVLGSDDGAVAAVAAGLQGQSPTLADLPGQPFGRAELDGARLAQELETLLLAYLRTQRGRTWWWGEVEASADESVAEVAETFGPFLGALRGLGKVRLDLTLTPAGLEGRVP